MVFRMFRIFSVCCLYIVWSMPAILRAVVRRETNFSLFLGQYMSQVLMACGGAFPKFGQILSSRPDLLPQQLCAQLAALQDQMPALQPWKIEELLQHEFLMWRLQSFEIEPDASATIAQVHRGIVAVDHREVALKILRPGVATQIEQDCRLAEAFAPAVQMLPAMRSVPVLEAVKEAGVAMRRQIDFNREASNLARLRKDFGSFPGILVPQVYVDLSSENVLCMEYVAGMKKLTDPAIPDRTARQLTELGLRALYRMIFETGFLHCDLHPGNLQVSSDGRLVILDAGLMTELDESTRNSFAQFFAAIALRRGRRAAEIVRATAAFLPPNLDCEAFDREIAELITRTGGLSAEHFQVAGFVSELFAIQGRHGIHGTSRFSLIILALLVYEGIAKQRHRSLDFQREAMPFVVNAVFRIR